MFPQGGVGRLRGLVIRFAPVVFGTVFLAATAHGQVTLSDSAFGFQNEFEWCKKLGENRAWLTATTAFGANGVVRAPNDPIFAISPQQLTEPVDPNWAWAVPPPRPKVPGDPSPIGLQTYLQGSNVAVDKILVNAFISWASYTREPGFLEFRGTAGKVMRYGLHWYGNHNVVRESPVELRETPLAHGMVAAPKTIGAPATPYPVFFRLEHTGCRPKDVAVTIEYRRPDKSVSIRSIPFRAEASSPQQSRIDIDSTELAKRFNGDLPQVLWISYNNEHAFGMPLETRIELRGTPSPDRIDMSQKLCNFPVNLDFAWDLPGRAGARGGGSEKEIQFHILNPGVVTNVGNMRIDIPLEMVRGAAAAGPREISVVIRGRRDLESTVLSGISLSLPIVNVPADLNDATPSGGCP